MLIKFPPNIYSVLNVPIFILNPNILMSIGKTRYFMIFSALLYRVKNVVYDKDIG